MRLLYVVTEDWAFLLHRLPMALAARDAGFEVHVATRVVNGRDAIQQHGITVHPIPFARGRLSPLASLRTVAALRRVQRQLAPSVTHHVALQSIVLGSLAAIDRPGAQINAMTGLGHVFVANDFKTRIVRGLIGVLLRFLFNRRRTVVLVENPDDGQSMAALGVRPDRIVLIPGSGVDVQKFNPSPEPAGPLAMAFVGRLIETKGIRVVVEALRMLRRRGSACELLIVGTPDPGNPASISAEEVAAWGREPGITWLGFVEDIAGVWARAAIAVLPSHREGVPVSLLEAAAAGRPMVATDVPGCREIVIPGKTGLLVPVNDAPALADAIATLADSPELRARYGAAARKLAVERFAATSIGRQVVDLYRSLAQLQRSA